MMLPRMAFIYLVRWLPCIWITALQELICVIKVVQYLLPFQAGLPDIESDQKTQYYSIPAYISTHLSVEADYLSWGHLPLEWHFIPQMAQTAFHH